MGSIIGHKIDYKGVGVLRGQRHIPSEKLTQEPPPGLNWTDVANFLVLMLHFVFTLCKHKCKQKERKLFDPCACACIASEN